MSGRNDVTGDRIINNKGDQKTYRGNFDPIFRKGPAKKGREESKAEKTGGEK